MVECPPVSADPVFYDEGHANLVLAVHILLGLAIH